MRITTLEQAVEVILQQQEQIKARQQQIKQLQEANQRLEKEVERLSVQLRKYHNENTPSGSLPPYLKDEIMPESKERKPSDQEKTSSNQRNSRPKPVREETHTLDACPNCDSPLQRQEKTERRVIVHLILPKAEAVGHGRPHYHCPNCGMDFVAEIPDALPNSKYGLELSLFVLSLSVLGLTQGKIAEQLRMFGLRICPSSINNIIHRVEKYMGDKRYQKLREEIRQSAHAGMDETSHRHRGENWQMLAVTTAKTAFYKFMSSRRHGLIRRLPMPKESISCDGYRAYDRCGLPLQRCWAHALRRARQPPYYFQSDREKRRYVGFVKRLGKLYHQAKNQKRRSAELQGKYDMKLKALLMPYAHDEEKNIRRVVNYLLRYEGDWFLFLSRKGIEPTNNRTERAIRPMVIQRKVKQHTWSAAGRHGLEKTQSIYQTCRLNGENFVDIIRHDVELNLHEMGKI